MSVYAVIPADIYFVQKPNEKSEGTKSSSKTIISVRENLPKRENSVNPSRMKDASLFPNLVSTHVCSSLRQLRSKSDYNSLIQSIIFQRKRRNSKSGKYTNVLSTIYEVDAPRMSGISLSTSSSLNCEVEEECTRNEEDTYCSECDAFFIEQNMM